jgi:hypothetical protein
MKFYPSGVPKFKEPPYYPELGKFLRSLPKIFYPRYQRRDWAELGLIAKRKKSRSLTKPTQPEPLALWDFRSNL